MTTDSIVRHSDRLVHKAQGHIFVVIWTAFAALVAFVYGCCTALPIIF